MPLTDVQCRSAKPRSQPYKLRDEKGLYLEVKPTGSKTWRYRFELFGKESIFTIGEYPSVTLLDARDARRAARELVKQGKSPVQERQLERIKRQHESQITFEVVANEWLATKEWQQETKDRRLDMLKRVVFPHIGQLPVRDITPAHVLALLKKVAPGAPTVAAQAKRTISGVFGLAISTLRADVDPVYPLRDALPKNKTQHKRALKPDEIGELLRDIAAYTGNMTTVGALRLMWLTLCRPSEAVEARWSEFDLEVGTWTIGAERMKMRSEHTVSLPTQAIAMLETMKSISGRWEHVFPHRDDRHQPMTLPALRQALKSMGWAGRYSPHATRVTGSTCLNNLGYPSDWIERQLAHQEPNRVRRTYNQALYVEDRAKMMQRWADYLDALECGGKVITADFRKSAA
ncbi:MAG: tyrosine-type recombinase/integrase [Burkholderia sp.]|jgi:integrase|nr:integrase arm-type DNA-binding domain-containing protein [Burkholderia sp.]MCA3781418.1 tyrosine-type recombinase/integrase [Burkholderia sp.]MCA3795510.1 tyrosine-type recombinase/integrase [Burkholderia sp.]MCA3802244.1 tyrosine-type recombinase/integrase [Burkholderia sp.]MCA3814361.1 tyrosine-type recombinase/integrase [Burkholderia sp.]MCA3831883.1 tyrosine-type recombinase/integrase [Burkholderia sp.]